MARQHLIMTIGCAGGSCRVRRRLISGGYIVAWQRVVLGVAILALSVTMFVPLPLWAAVVCISVATLAALMVILHMVFSRPRS